MTEIQQALANTAWQDEDDTWTDELDDNSVQSLNGEAA